MQAVFVCGGKGTRLRPNHVGPKSFVCLGGSTLLERLVGLIGPLHRSQKPPVVVIDAEDSYTPEVLRHVLPDAHIVHQARADGVANALLLAQPFLDDVVIVVLGDLFVDGTFATLPRRPALVVWREAPIGEIRKNFGLRTNSDGSVLEVVEKPVDCRRLSCGMGVYVLDRFTISCCSDAPVDARTGERGITGAIQTAIQRGVGFEAVSFSGYYNNVNCPSDVIAVEHYLRAQQTG